MVALWRIFRFLWSEMLFIGIESHYIIGTYLMPEKESSFAKHLIERFLRSDMSRLIIGHFSLDEVSKIFRKVILNYDQTNTYILNEMVKYIVSPTESTEITTYQSTSAAF